MQLVLLVIHMMIAVALVGVVLLQKSEGGALGIGGGGGGFMTGRGTANLLTRTTAFLAAAFFASSLSLTLLAQHTKPTGSVLDKATISAPATPGAAAPAASDAKPGDTKPGDIKIGDDKPADAKPAGRGGILDKLDPQPQPPLPR